MFLLNIFGSPIQPLKTGFASITNERRYCKGASSSCEIQIDLERSSAALPIRATHPAANPFLAIAGSKSTTTRLEKTTLLRGHAFGSTGCKPAIALFIYGMLLVTLAMESCLCILKSF